MKQNITIWFRMVTLVITVVFLCQGLALADEKSTLAPVWQFPVGKTDTGKGGHDPKVRAAHSRIFLQRVVNEEIKRLVAKIRLSKPIPYALGEVVITYSYACPLNCGHCGLWQPLKRMELMTDETLDLIIEKIRAYDDNIGITISGGEPFLFIEKLCRLVRGLENRRLYITTSGLGLGDSVEEAKRCLKQLVSGVQEGRVAIGLSVDKWHNISAQCRANIIEAIVSDEELFTKIDLCLNCVTDPIIGPIDESIGLLYDELCRRGLIDHNVTEKARISSEFYNYPMPVKIAFLGRNVVPISVARFPAEFIGNYEGKNGEMRTLEIIDGLFYDCITIIPNGDVSIEPFFAGLLTVGNILYSGEDIETLKEKAAKHPIVYLTSKDSTSVTELFACASILMPERMTDQFKRQHTSLAQVRILLEEPAMNYCLTIYALKRMIDSGIIANPGDFKDLVSGDDGEFLENLKRVYDVLSEIKEPGFLDEGRCPSLQELLDSV